MYRPQFKVLCKKKSASKSLRATATVLLSLILSASCSSWREEKRVADASRSLAASLTQTDKPPSESKPATAIEDQRVYIDGSLSMKGFVNASNHTTFDDLIDEIGNALPGCRLFKYGQAGERSPENLSDLMRQTGFGLELHTPGFYDLAYNPDDRLIDSFANDEHSVLSVLISDGVYSEPRGSTSPPVVDAIQRWMQSGRTLGILVLKSSFNGPFYSERRRGWLPPLSVESRPFYIFVFSPTDAAFTDLRDKLTRRFPEIQSYVFSDASVSSTLMLPEDVKGAYSSELPQPPSVLYYWQMFDSDLFNQKPTATVNYVLGYSTSPYYPAAEFKPSITTEYYRWDGIQFKKEDEIPSGFQQTVDAYKANNNALGSVAFTLQIPRGEGAGYSLYRLKVSTSISSLRQDIMDLSTRDDSVRENANKTFRFFELITALTDIHFKARLAKKTSPSLFVTTENR